MLLAPFQGFLAYVERRAASKALRQQPHLEPLLAASRFTPSVAASAPVAPSRLRIVREFEPGVSPAFAGRMVISGRMSDVCAELDRMSRCGPMH
jgi:hypothetical protein